MQLVRRFRIPALFCALAVLLCELISHPFANMAVCDDGPYILMARTLATTGHIVFNGGESAMMGWQLYLGAAFTKLFGFSFTSVRMSALLVAMVLAFLLQRTFVRASICERNATIGTLALVLSPLYLMLSATFMTDITGLFAVVPCLYGCLRALRSSTSRATIGWLTFSVVTNAILGTSRQTAWLGILVMVPCALWLLRARRGVFLAGAAATLAGALFILSCMLWFQHQPYSMPEHLLIPSYPVAHILGQYTHAFLDVPFLLLPITVVFIPELRHSTRRSIAVSSAILVGYILLAIHSGHINWGSLLEPALQGQWVNVYGIVGSTSLQGLPPNFLDPAVQVLFTIASISGLFGLIASILAPRNTHPTPGSSACISWTQIVVLLAPYTAVYGLLLIPRAATTGIFDRYLLGLLFIPLLCLLRYYQEQVHSQIPTAATLLICVMAIYGIAITHNTFALYRARVAFAAQLRASGVPDTSVDNGWEYNMGVELQHADHLNDPRIAIPAHAYIPVAANDFCKTFWYDRTPHIHPLYGISFDPNACYGPAPFAPTHYSRWLASAPGTLYVVRYTAASTP